MADETRPSARSSNPTKPSKKNGQKIKRSTVTTSGKTFTVPLDASFLVIQNVGSNIMRFNFSTDAASDYWVLQISETSPVLILRPGVEIKLQSQGGDTTAQYLFWSE